MWAVFFLTLPTRATTVRMRVVRALKGMGSPLLRDATYLLPYEQRARFLPLAREVEAHGGTADIMRLVPVDDVQRAAVVALFDRGEQYAAWQAAWAAWSQDLPKMTPGEALARWSAQQQALAELQAIDYYPGSASSRAVAELSRVRQQMLRFFPDEVLWLVERVADGACEAACSAR